MAQDNGTAAANGTVAFDPYDVSTWTPEQIKAWWDFTFLFLGIMQDVKYFTVATTALVVYEYIITLDQEAELVYGWRRWRTGWNLPNVLFILNRYFILLAMAVGLATSLWPDPPLAFCTFATRFLALSGIFTTIVANTGLIIRQYAFWNRDRRIVWFLGGLLAGCIGGGLYSTVTGFAQMQPLPKWGPALPEGCLMTPPTHIWASFVGVLVFDTALFIVTVIQAWRLRRHAGKHPSPITTHLLRSGTWYFSVLFVFTLISFVVSYLNNNWLSFVWVPSNILPAMTSIMCSRLLLGIRSELKDAKTPHLRTAVTGEIPTSPMSPDVEGMFNHFRRGSIEHRGALRDADTEMQEASIGLPSVVVDASDVAPSHLARHSDDDDRSSRRRGRSTSRRRDTFRSSFELRGSSLSQASSSKTDDASPRW